MGFRPTRRRRTDNIGDRDLSNSDTAPALTDARGMGGIIAQDGFDYQLWDGLVRLPAWLANPAFEQMIFEGLEDLEARFFAPHAPRVRLLERYQAKAGALAPADVRAVLQTFSEFEAAYPSAARVQTLVTPRLPPTISWLARDPERVRKARPFYAPFSDVMAASDAELQKQLIDTYGDALGAFVAASVEISERNLPAHDAAVVMFGLELDRVFPTLEAPQRRVAAAFEALSSLARRSIGAPLARAILCQTIEGAIGRPLPLPETFPLHIRSDRNEVNEQSLEIDASPFSGGDGAFPSQADWTDNLLAPLSRTSNWLKGQSVPRIALSGSYRLTTAMAIGHAFRSAVGFELDIPTRDGFWATDDRPSPDMKQPWRISEPKALHGDHLIVSVGILRDPSADLEQTASIPAQSVLALYLEEPIPSAKSAQAAVSVIKRTVDIAVARLRPKGVQLYFAGPAALAVALGHRWNAVAPTQLHEFIMSKRSYVATALI